MIGKPALPTAPGDAWERIPLDNRDGLFDRLVQAALFASDGWTFGPDGPHRNPGMTNVEITRQQFREGFAHLLELGFVDVDAERVNAAPFMPMNRVSS